MSCELPYRRDFPTARAGRTFPGIRYQIEGTTTLTAVSCVVKDSDGATALTLSTGGTGMTLTSGTIGAWDFEVDTITAVSLSSGFYTYEMTLTSDDSSVVDWFVGQWKIND